MRWQRIVFSVTVTEGLLTEVFEKRKGCGRKAITPVVARILSGDSTSPLTRDGHGCPKLNAQSFARMRNRQSVHMARMWCWARDSAKRRLRWGDWCGRRICPDRICPLDGGVLADCQHCDRPFLYIINGKKQLNLIYSSKNQITILHTILLLQINR